MFIAQVLNGQRGRGITSHHQGFHMVLVPQRVPDRPCTFTHKSGISLAIRCMGAVGHVDKIFCRHVPLQGLQNAQAAHAAVKHPDRRVHWLFTAMPLNSPEAMRLDHSAGPVMWALVPPASTATVTGMSTTSNS